jgi:16S rRNA (adenine1518-N6/adenine1519-N6)-dimethyltransferase
MTRRPPRDARRPAHRPRPHAPARHQPRRRFGQHFLSPTWARKIADAIAPRPGDVFLEIGPGAGALTLPLAESGAPILAVEIDRDLVADLAPRVPRNVTVMSGDVLTTDVLAFLTGLEPQRTPHDAHLPPPARRFRIVGNLPYNISSPLLFRMIEWHRRHAIFADATIMLQREVADRIVAKPDSREYGVLTVMLGMHATTRRLINLPPAAFKPAPKVHSAVVNLTFTPPSVRVADEALFERMVKAMFGQRRKTLANALKSFDATAPAILALAQIDGRRRPETLQLAEMAHLADLFAAVRQGRVL